MASANGRLKTAQTTTGDTPKPRQRPKDRRDQIIRVAAESFSQRGYFATGVDQIAGEVGISGPALYRHFPNKYALFSETVRTLGADLERAVEVVPELPGDPEQELRLLITELTRTTIDNRSRGALYRWEARYLTQPDRQALGEMVGRMHTRFATPLGKMRPELTESNPTVTGRLNTDARYLSGSLLSVIGSITTHRASLPRKRIEAIIMSAAMTVARTELPPVEAPVGDAAAGPVGMAMASKREALLTEAIRLMRGRGFHDVTMEEIGAAVGMNQSGVYRHFDTKVAMLTAAFQRASERLTAGISDALAESATPREALDNLVSRYVEMSFVNSDLLNLYLSEIGSVPDPLRAELRDQQRRNVEEWAQLVVQIRPDLNPVEARYLVHAATNTVLDLGNWERYDARPSTRRRIEAVMSAILLGNGENIT
ncbi:MAG: TetR family transcriptional regulator [Gordonia sp. (in: high G+C Gram-positive bacteria)]|nr:MAG: TetR family transcriptional regulator [Gordonia sp. (in: high G+C Gram-positive bacteria)]